MKTTCKLSTVHIERTVEEQTKHRNDHYIIFFSLKHFFNIRVPFLAAAITNHSCGFSLFCPQQRKFHKIHGGTWLSKIHHLHIFYSWMCAPNLVATRVQCIKIWYEKNQNSKHKFINADINHWRIYTLSKLNTITAEKMRSIESMEKRLVEKRDQTFAAPDERKKSYWYREQVAKA